MTVKFIPEMQVFLIIYKINIIHHLNKLKEKKSVMSIDAEKKIMKI